MTDPLALSRRHALGLMGAAAGAGLLPAAARAATGAAPAATWRSTTAARPWQSHSVPALAAPGPGLFAVDASLMLDAPRQTMAGFGGAFSEKGWEALSLLAPKAREAALAALFGADGCAFSLCRTPIGASDFARKWYSYDETPGDFALDHFSIANDRETLIPFIKAAQSQRPDLKLWASPWSPPSWMKKGGHYAQSPAWPGQPANGIAPTQLGHEGADSFIQEDRYFDAYARYFARYVEAYGQEGIAIGTVMPQNEFNSAQPYASCCWTPLGLARFLPFLGRAMDKAGVSVFLGTLERGNPDLVSQVMADPAAASVVKGLGVQWAGKSALPVLRSRYPGMTIWGTEQECGTATNDWHYARYGWATIRQYFDAGISAWTYWNMVLPKGGLSNWGWPQNSLIVVDPVRRDFTLTQDYWLMRHLAGDVRPGARAIAVDSFLGFADQIAFRNPDGSLVLVANNGLGQPQQVRYGIGKQVLTLDLPADSLNTIVLPAHMAP
ncbi:MAG TPA: glycoside hydrolase family 30 beta sandwich domain-containing protein [Novosphingobium sp.]|nr:glycoside hydrolase family 30 beta sandwich domain-containing protein [Novosphingobium sp.]